MNTITHLIRLYIRHYIFCEGFHQDLPVPLSKIKTKAKLVKCSG